MYCPKFPQFFSIFLISPRGVALTTPMVMLSLLWQYKKASLLRPTRLGCRNNENNRRDVFPSLERSWKVHDYIKG